MAFDSKDGINQNFLEELKSRNDIVSTISQYVPLTKKGGKYFGCCPFHNEKTGSFCVNTDGQYYHCFGCGSSGNVISFIMEIESLSFIDAVKFLADRANMEMPEFKSDPKHAEKKEKREILLGLMRDAALYYRNNLTRENEGKEAREYLQSRGITEEVARTYGMGLSLGYDQLYGYMRRKGYSTENLRDCGLIVGENNVDAFAGRIIVPIIDGMGNVVAFGGRIYHGEQDVAKYKNSTNTFIFDKGRTLYGVNYIKKEKRAGGSFKELILVEGYMDVISLGAAGIKNAVAGMGTALTPGQANEIKRLVPTVYVCYDGDGAGKKATIRNIDVLRSVGLDVKVVSLAEGLDPDDTIKKEGYEGFMARVRDALSVIEYKLKLCADAYNLDSVEGRGKYVTACLKVLKEIESPSEREVYLSVVSGLSRVSVETLSKELAKDGSAKTQRRKEIAPVDKEPKNMKASRFVLNKILTKASYANAELVKKEWLPHPLHQEIFDRFVSSGGTLQISSLFDEENDNEELGKIVGDKVAAMEGPDDKIYFADCLVSLANDYLSARLEKLKNEYATLSSPEDKKRNIEEIATLQKKLKSKNVEDKT